MAVPARVGTAHQGSRLGIDADRLHAAGVSWGSEAMSEGLEALAGLLRKAVPQIGDRLPLPTMSATTPAAT